MSPPPIDDALSESFFDALYPAQDAAPLAEAPEEEGTDTGRLNRLVEQWPDPVLVVDPQLHCVLANRACQPWCQAPAGHLPLPLEQVLLPSLWEAVLPHVASALRCADTDAEERLLHPTLGLRHMRLRAQAERSHGRVVSAFVYLQDITDQRHAATPHTRSADTDAHLRLMAEGLRDAAIFFLDAQGHINDWPPSAERLLGHRADQVLGRPVSDVTSPADASTADDPMLLGMERAALLGQSETPGWQRRADGSAFWANTLLTVLHDETTGELQGYACLMRDVTEVQRLIDMLQELNHTLEARVDERTRQLQDINQDLEAFSYSVSHDLRAPLRHITSYVALLREDLGPQAPADALQDLERLADAARHMGLLIEGLLAFSRLGRAALQRRTVAMGDLLHSSLNRVQHDPALRRPEGEVVWTLPGDWPEVQGDGLLLSQVWDNLLANALKYSRPRQPAHIAVGWRRDDTEVVFWVRDDGVGFDPRRADKLFGVFQRLHRATEFEGTGIGLALCRRIVERHGGRIWAEGQPGSGSTFHFALPGSAAPDQPTQAAG